MRAFLPHRADPLLLPYLQTTSEETADELLFHLIDSVVRPIAKRLISFLDYKYDQSKADYVDDVVHQVCAQIIPVLRELRESPGKQEISNFRGYVRMIIYNEYKASKCPRWWSLRKRIYYLLLKRKDLALWETSNRRPVAGLRSWLRKGKIPLAPHQVELLKGKLDPLNSGSTIKSPGKTDLELLLREVFRQAGSPIDLNDLTSLVANHLGVNDRPHLSIADVQYFPPACSWSGASALESEQYLKRVWQEICRLQLKQRRALLLNFRYAQNGDDGLELLVYAGIVTKQEIAAAVNIPYQQFVILWNKLPLPDNEIANLLNVTRQEVINIRNYARQMLAREMERIGDELCRRPITRKANKS